jgi:Fe(3+) dicitrate transport protein
MLSASVGYRHGAALDLRLEAVFVGAQFGDALNTQVTVPDGQQGVIPTYTVWNAAVNYEIAATRTTVFLTAKNLFERTYVVDRTRGILPGSPRLVQAGVMQRL